MMTAYRQILKKERSPKADLAIEELFTQKIHGDEQRERCQGACELSADPHRQSVSARKSSHRLGHSPDCQRIARVLVVANQRHLPRLRFKLKGVTNETDAVARGYFRVVKQPNTQREHQHQQ